VAGHFAGPTGIRDIPALDPELISVILDAVADGITVQGPDGRVILANLAAARASGYETPRAFLEVPSKQLLERFELLDEDRESLSWSDLPGPRVLAGEPVAGRVVGYRDRATGQERWVSVTALPITDPRGQVVLAVNAFHDITDRKRAEDELREQQAAAQALLAARLGDEVRLAELVTAERARSAELDAIIGAIGEGIVVIDPNGELALANSTGQRLLGPRAGLDLDGLLDRFEGLEGLTLPALIEKGPVSGRLRGPEDRWIELAAYAVEAPAEGVGGSTILVLRDVTEARTREQARDAFIGVLSHELRTPVTTIYAGAKVLARTESKLSEEDRLSIFEDLHAEAERLHRLVEDVVALTRVGEGALEVGNEPVLLQRVLPMVVRSEEGRWPGGRFELHLPPDLPPVAGDTTYVEQVVRNLLANAMKYGGSDSVARVEARLSRDESEVEIRVLDSGPGFPNDASERLFELYYRSPEIARQISGSGIGLFVCARLIAAMGGHIWAANRPTGGSEFGFALRAMRG